jgi:hypothetical protein
MGRDYIHDETMRKPNEIKGFMRLTREQIGHSKVIRNGPIVAPEIYKLYFKTVIFSDGFERRCVIVVVQVFKVHLANQRVNTDSNANKNCHRANQNQPVMSGSKPATLRPDFHSRFGLVFK